MRVDVMVIGAGAAGMFAAIEAGRRGRRVLLVDHARDPGEKIRISGGGRCNFTNLNTSPAQFLSANPRFAASALSRYPPARFIERLDAAGITWHEKTLGQLFCDGPATQVVALLVADLKAAGGVLRLSSPVGAITRDSTGFRVALADGSVQAESLIIATGGKSIPKMGATGFGYEVARQFGLPVTDTRPGLVPLTFAEQALGPMKPLAGVAVPGMAAAGGGRFAEAILFTHRGLSGPAILQVSSYWREGMPLTLDLAPGWDAFAVLRAERARAGRRAAETVLATRLPKALAGHLAADWPGNLADLPDRALRTLAARVNGWELRPVGTEGYRTAEVTLGGVDTAALDSRTMQAKAVPGLYFVGEVVDVTGWLGGYNFQWAWASGWAAGQVA